MSDEAIARLVANLFRPAYGLTRADYVGIAWVAVWRARQRYDPNGGSALSTWLRMRAYDAVRTAIRDSSGVSAYAYYKGIRFPALPLGEDVEIRDTRPSPETVVVDQDAARCVMDAVRRLPVAQRGAVMDRLAGRRPRFINNLTRARRNLSRALWWRDE